MKKIFSKILVSQHKKSNVRDRKFHNFQSARSAGILFNASDNTIYAEAKSLLAYFKQKQIKTEGMGFADKQQIDSFYKTYTGFNFFSQKDFNFIGKPKSQMLKDFIEQKFDILIDLSFSDEISYHTICSMSLASFKAGPVVSRRDEYDFIIELNEEEGPAEFVRQLKHYLETIETSSNEPQQI